MFGRRNASVSRPRAYFFRRLAGSGGHYGLRPRAEFSARSGGDRVFEPGAYTIVLTGVGTDLTGTALIEAYDRNSSD